MTTYVALLHSIILTQERRVVMADLRAMAESLGFRSPRTLVATGNLVFEARTATLSRIESKLETAFKKTFGRHVDIIVRDAAGWRKLVAGNPFPQESAADGAKIGARISRAPLESELAATLQPYLTRGERVKIVGGDLWMCFSGKPSESKLLAALTPKRLGGAGTLRNWNTIRNLGDMLDD